MKVRDVQWQRVYDWEASALEPLNLRQVALKDAQMFVNGVWLAHGWLYPPSVMRQRPCRRIVAKTNGDEVHLRDQTPAWVILHELAHVLTLKQESHGADFVGVYLKLLDDVLNLSVVMMTPTLRLHGIKYNLGARLCPISAPQP